MLSKALANPNQLPRLLLARTDGRTNGRTTHLLETSSVPYRAGEIEVFTRSDLEFQAFVLTRNVTKVRRERFVESIQTTLTKKYDQETERQRAAIDQERKRAA